MTYQFLAGFFGLSHIGVILISFGTTQFLFFKLTSDMINGF